MTMKVLHIDSSALGAASVTRDLTAAAVQAFVDADPSTQVTYRDLAATPLAHLDGRLLQALRPVPGAAPTHDPALLDQVALTDQLIGEFLAADVIVIGAPMYNFSIPSQLKAWIDRLAQPGRTFNYTANGPVGLAGGRKVVIASGRGGVYAGAAHETALDHQEAYLRAVLGFFGITDVTVVRAEGIAMGPASRERAMTTALDAARKLADVGEPALA
jgi:FMN-dependent NADH-azoreductase